jgi:hypothetical protein
MASRRTSRNCKKILAIQAQHTHTLAHARNVPTHCVSTSINPAGHEQKLVVNSFAVWGCTLLPNPE